MFVTDYLNALGAYNLTPQSNQMLEWMRAVGELGGEYFWTGVVVPPATDINFAARFTKEYTVAVQPNSILLTMAGMSTQPEGFQVSVMDKGSRTLLYTKGFAKDGVSSPNVDPFGLQQDNPFGPYMLLSPFTLTNPGQLQVQITSLSGSAALIQVVFGFAVPFKAQQQAHSTGQRALPWVSRVDEDALNRRQLIDDGPMQDVR